MSKQKVVLLAMLCLAVAGCDIFTSTDTRLGRAEQQMAAADYRGALIELKNVLQKEPDNARARLDIAETVLNLSDPTQAEHELARAIKAGADKLPRAAGVPDPADLDARIRIALGKSAELLADLDSGKLIIAEPTRLVYRGQALAGLNRFDEAKVAFESALQADPKLTAARIGLARAYVGQGNAEAALKELDTILAQTPDAAEAWMVKGTVLMLARRGPEAEPAFEQARKHSQKLTLDQHVRLLAVMADIKLMRGDVDSAVQLQSELAKLSGEAPVTRLLAARILVMRKDYVTAAADLQRLLSDVPNFVPAQVLLGAVLLAQGNPVQAEVQLNQALQKAPNDTTAHRLLAQVRKQLGRPDAEPAVQQAAAPSRKINPDFVKAADQVKAGDKAGAITTYQGMLAKQPNNPIVLNNLAWLYQETGDARALETARKAHEIVPNAPEIQDTYGWLLVQAGRIDEGLKLLEAASRASDDPAIDKHYSEVRARAQPSKTP